MKCRCSECEYGSCGGPNPLSDFCDGCQHDPEAGWYGFTDYSVSDEDGFPMHFDNEQEQKDFYSLFDDEDDYGW